MRMYLITGGAGHLGTAIVKRLAGEDCAVRVLCVPGETRAPENAEVMYGNVLDVDSMRPFFEAGEATERIVIHCAGIVSISSTYDQRVYDVNVKGARNVVDLCVETGVNKLIYVSSVHALPERSDGLPITEEAPPDAGRAVGLYAQTKAEATGYVLAANSRGLDAEVVYPSGIIGPYDAGRSHTNALITDYIRKRLTSAIEGGYDFVDVRDVADGIIACADRGRPGEGYILSGEYHTIREILTLLHEITGTRLIRSYLPLWFVKATAPLCEMYYKIRRKPPLFTSYSIFTLSQNARFSHDKASRQLGYAPRDIGTTLRDTVEWMHGEGRF